MEKKRLLNTYVNDLTLNEAVDALMQCIRAKTSAYVVEVNVDVVVKMESDPELRAITNRAAFTFVDGQPLIWVAKWYRRPLKAKISGSDLVPALLQQAAREGRSVFILGGMEDTAQKAAKNVEKDYPGIVVAGALSPSWGFENKSDELAQIDRVIAAAKPDILLACFGCPKQEKWVAAHYRTAGAAVTLCAGATVDFLAGNVQRAPRFLSENGLEWFYRFTKEPKRLFRRYFVDDVKILGLVWKYRKEKA